MKSRMQNIEASKSRMRRKLAARPVAEKLRMLDDLRARAIALKKSYPKRSPVGRFHRGMNPDSWRACTDPFMAR